MKNIFLITSLFLGAGYYFGKNKIKGFVADYQNAFKQLQITLNTINSLKITGGALAGKIILDILNNSELDLGLDTQSLVTLKKLTFFTQDNLFIGEAFPNMSNIQLPKNAITTLPEIDVNIPLNLNALDVALSLLQSTKNIKVVSEVEAFNQTYKF